MSTKLAENVEERPEVQEQVGTATEATYNDYLIEKIEQMFNKEEKDAFIVASDKKRPVTIRINSLLEKRNSILQKLSNRGVNIEKIDWNACGAVIYNTEVPVGATPEYLAGQYMLQSPSSMLAVMALDPQENETVVDMCAAPGGKTTHIAAQMNNTGVVYASDNSKERIKALVSNVQRMGVTNTICTVSDALKLLCKNVDRVLLDAPCSGTGVISKDPAVKRTKDEAIVRKLQQQQKKLILKAFDMLSGRKNEGSYMVYSTCSILVEENECVVDYLLKKRNTAKIVDAELPIGKNGFRSYRGFNFHPAMSNTRRLYPHVHNTDGFFVAKIKKTGISTEEQRRNKEEQKKIDEKVKEKSKEKSSKEDAETKKKEGRRNKPFRKTREDKETGEDEIKKENNAGSKRDRSKRDGGKSGSRNKRQKKE